jgi:hypothetical protein
MLNITHTSGFFSCCSSKLTDIVSFFNKNRKLPEFIDTKEQFSLYKQNNRKDDITFDYFKYNDDEIKYSGYVDYHWMYQFCDYKKLNYNMILPFVKKYFGITKEIQNIINSIEIKYNLDYLNICVLFHRGNDKCTETKICNYNDTIYQANKIKANNPNIILNSTPAQDSPRTSAVAGGGGGGGALGGHASLPPKAGGDGLVIIKIIAR